MPLTILICHDTQVTDLSPLEDCKSLKTLQVTNTKVTPAQVAALQKALPNCKIEWDDPAKTVTGQPSQPWNSQAFQAWVKATQALPAEKQIEAVSKKLMELNPGFDGKVTGADGKGTPKIENGVVMEIGFVTDNVGDISPVRALAGLKALGCGSSVGRKGKLSDLSPLEGMKLASLYFHNTEVSDVSPLRAMPLTNLGCAGTQVSDLSPLTGMKLTTLMCEVTPVSDLSPLRGMPLARLTCGSTQISDLAPLKGMPLVNLRCIGAKVSDLSPLDGMNLSNFAFTPKNITKGLDVIRQMKSLKTIGVDTVNMFTTTEFWKKYDAGEFGKPAATTKLAYLDPAFQQWVKATQALPAEKQVEAVSKKLMELNPGFDGKVTNASGNVTPTQDP